MQVRAIRDFYDGALRKAGDVFEHVGELHEHIEPVIVADRDELLERFHRVILGAGYSENAAQRILEEYFEKYLADISEFVKMLEDYEHNQFDLEGK